MDGAALRSQERRAEILFTAMLPQLEKPIPFDDFVTGKKDKRAEIAACLAAWDRLDRALTRKH